MRKILFTFFAGVIFLTGAFAESAANAFHFNHYKLTNESLISAAYLNSEIGEADRIVLSSDGHLEANGKRLRIFGTNLSEFPTSHRQADFYAQALANQGYNCIRFHHTDANWTNCFLKKNPAGKWVVDKKRLDDFDYFFAALKKNGIYSNLNLLTGRDISSADGYKKELDLVSGWKSRHCLGFWDEDALNLQKEWAAFLLEHENPYTKTVYKDDPALAIVEVNNENGLMMAYLAGWLEDYNGDYWQELEDKWNLWLLKNNLTYDSLSTTYNSYSKFSNTLVGEKSRWYVENHNGAKFEAKNDGKVTSIKVLENGSEAWHIQYNTSKLSFSDDKIYTVKFSVKSSSPSKLNVSIMQAHEPWAGAGWGRDVETTSEWKNYTFTVKGISTDKNLRFNFSGMGLSKGTTFYFKNLSIREGGKFECVRKGKKSLSRRDSVLLPHYEEYKTLPLEYRNLILSFLYETEENYWLSMRDYLKDTLKCQSLLMGTVVGCSTAAIQSCYDIIDTHAYWNHPSFPGTDWDTSNYYVNNFSLTKETNGNTLLNLAKSRVYGKPFSVSEYDHPYPNQFSSEMYAMISSFAAFQDWDCIFTFCSCLPSKADGQKEKITGYFDQSNNPAKSCAAPFAARIFREFLVEPAKFKSYVKLSRQKEMENLYKFSGWNIGNAEIFGSFAGLAALGQLGLNLEGVTSKEFIKEASLIDKLPEMFISNDPGMTFFGFDVDCNIYWDTKSGVYIVCNENVTVAVLSAGAELCDIPDKWKNNLLPALSKAEERDFTSFMAVKDSRTAGTKDERYLIFSCSWSGNTGEALRPYGQKEKYADFMTRNSEKITSLYNCGRGPAKALTGNAAFTLNGKHNLYKVGLDGNKGELLKKDSSSFELSSSMQTLWFLLE